MPTITTKDGTQIYYKDWGSGQPIVFSHGWPLTADDWDAQMLFFGQHGYRVIAHDRRGHGRSTQTWDGNEMNTYADDLAALTEHLGHHRSDPRWPLDRWRRSCPLHRAAWLQSRCHGSTNQRGATADAEDGQESRWRTHLGLRRPASPISGESPAVLQGYYAPVLRLQPPRRQDLGGHPGALVVAGHDGRRQAPLRLH